MAGRWRTDVLGDDYRARTLELADDDEGSVVATLVRYAPPTPVPVRPARAVLYLHGWSDYFFQTGLAEFWHAQGAAFYALDLRKCGRSLLEHQTPGYVTDLTTYDEEISAALDQVHRDLGQRARVLLMGHSTGGLISVLWAQHHPGTVHSVVLNSPWLELQGSSVVRHISAPAVARLAQLQPKAPLPNVDTGFYARTLRAVDGGEWTYDERWRPVPSFPVRAGWLAAVLAGHAEVARGLQIGVPVLVAASARSLLTPWWNDDMRAADVVLDVEPMVRRALHLGPVVTVVRIADGVHDLALSPRPVRDQFYAEILRWSTGYGWG